MPVDLGRHGLGLSTRRRMAFVTGLQGTLHDLTTVARALLKRCPVADTR